MQEVAASYGLGAVGGYVYLRMLHRSIDAVAGEGGGSSSASRLLVPVVLVLAANRYCSGSITLLCYLHASLRVRSVELARCSDHTRYGNKLKHNGIA